jgi:hypothetical protein
MIVSKIRVRMYAPALASISLLVAGCSTVETQSFNVGTGGNVESAQIAVDADFSRYDRLQAEEMGIYFPAGVVMRAADLDRLRGTFREAFFAELEGYSISSQPGPTTMQVQATLIDLRGSAGTDVSSLRRDIRDIATSGSLVFLMEMRDSTSGRVLARAADSAKAPSLGTSTGADTDWTAVDDAAEHWARLFRQFLDENLGR